MTKGIQRLFARHRTQRGNARHPAENPRRGRTEKLERTGRGQTLRHRHIHTSHNRRQEALAADRRAPLRLGQQGRQQGRHRMQHGGFVDAVKLLPVDLVGVDESCRGRGQTHAPPQDASLIASPPALRHGQHRIAMRRPHARHAHGQRVMQKGDRSFTRRRRHIGPAQAQRVIDQQFGGIGHQCGSSPPDTFMLSPVI